MDNKSIPGFTEEQVRAVLQSQAGRQLMAMLQQNGGAALKQAAAAARSGAYDQAWSQLQPVLDNPKAAALLAEIQKANG